MRLLKAIITGFVLGSGVLPAVPPEDSLRVTPIVRTVRKTEPAVAAVFSQGEGRLSMGSGSLIHKDGYVLTND
ncbi:MAG: hypothetical protein H8E24_14715, partial [Verrucomicrobia bacterium]|nr:hypothetical protein [Verrucomicrobiota bacterium]